MRLFLDLQAFQSLSDTAKATPHVTGQLVDLAKMQREIGFELLIGYNARLAIESHPLFRTLAIYCPPVNFFPYPFPDNATPVSERAQALLVEQVWVTSNPDAVLVAVGNTSAPGQTILPEGLPRAAGIPCGALLVDDHHTSHNDWRSILKERIQVASYDFLIAEGQDAANQWVGSGIRDKRTTLWWPNEAPLTQAQASETIATIRGIAKAHGHGQSTVRERRPRLALFTPLSPDGGRHAANYYRQVLPYVGRQFAVDLWDTTGEGIALSMESPLALSPTHEFAAVANEYDLIAYAIGNSHEFAPLLEYLQAFPGVVILHDESFEALFGALEAASGTADVLINEALFTDGTRTRHMLSQGADRAVDTCYLKLGRTLYELATGLIVFSPGHRSQLERQLGRRWPTPIETVRHCGVQTAELRDVARQMMGFGSRDRVFIFPHSLLRSPAGRAALSQLARHAPADTKLIALNASCLDEADEAIRKRVRFTGPLTEEHNARYIAAADVAIYPGSGPAGWVEQCLASGAEILCLDAECASFFGGALLSLPYNGTWPIVAGQMTEASGDALASEDPLSCARQTHASAQWSTRASGGELAEALLRLLGKAATASPITLGERLAQISKQTKAPATEVEALAKAIIRGPMAPRLAPQRVLIDVTSTSSFTFVTGIQRVVKEVTTRMCCLDRPGLCVEPVTLIGGKLYEPTPWLYRNGLLRPEELPARTAGREVVPEARDVMLMIDSTWGQLADFTPMYQRIQRGAGAVYTVIYDLIPIRFPQYVEKKATAWFARWVERIIPLSDGVIAISKVVADDIIDYIREQRIPHKPGFRVGYWHLGSVFKTRTGPVDPSERTLHAGKNRPFLMVGTIEPRKRHELVLDAFESVWRNDADAELAIAGREGWMVKPLMDRLRGHPELGKRLHLIEEASDDELAYLYERSRALIMASDVEGFGLPVIEAAQHGKPLILSDIPVFREIAGEHATYFRPGDRNDLARTLVDSWSGKTETDSSKIAWLNWDESVAQLAEVILDQKWYKILD